MILEQFLQNKKETDSADKRSNILADQFLAMFALWAIN